MNGRAWSCTLLTCAVILVALTEFYPILPLSYILDCHLTGESLKKLFIPSCNYKSSWMWEVLHMANLIYFLPIL